MIAVDVNAGYRVKNFDSYIQFTHGHSVTSDLEKVGRVVLKCDYAITANSKEHNHFYYLNNQIFKKSEYRWNSIHKTNRQMFHNIYQPVLSVLRQPPSSQPFVARHA